MTAQTPTSRPRIPADFIRFALAGLFSFVVDAGTLWACYRMLGTPLWLATTAGFWLSFVSNFAANRYFTFGVRSRGGRQLFRYSVLVGLNYLATLGIVTGLAAVGLNALAAKTLAVAVLMIVNFFAYRNWVFRD
ncbi:MAG TPA: GtrA family protein [Blastococcus sp.]|nr:GtrA family protein [Blastococcus sp.]